MQVSVRNSSALANNGIRAFAAVDSSSWISWFCFGTGLMLALTPEAAADLAGGGAGFGMIAGSIALFFLCTAMIQRHMRLSLLSSSFGRPSQLVTTGVFAASRNPIYLAFLIPLLSIAVYSVSAALAAASLYVWTMTRFVIRREEAELTRLFGAAYREYCAHTPRWLVF